MVIEINKDIDRYKESVVMGLTAKQLRAGKGLYRLSESGGDHDSVYQLWRRGVNGGKGFGLLQYSRCHKLSE